MHRFITESKGSAASLMGFDIGSVVAWSLALWLCGTWTFSTQLAKVEKLMKSIVKTGLETLAVLRSLKGLVTTPCNSQSEKPMRR